MSSNEFEPEKWFCSSCGRIERDPIFLDLETCGQCGEFLEYVEPVDPAYQRERDRMSIQDYGLPRRRDY